MLDTIHQLYQQQVYPPMSHPLADPAVSAVAAKIGGLDVPHPQRARILEIGCCSGHHLIPLAMRWPESRLVGIDLAERSIHEARHRAAVAGVENIEFHAVDLRNFDPTGGPFDFIIAHGFFSWVPNEVKAALLRFCCEHLSPSGIATISFNLACGWKPRLPVIAKVRAIQQARGGSEVEALEILRSLMVAGDPEISIIDDMFAKGAAILAFDDFGPVNDPWALDDFACAAAGAGLRWLGESDPGENIPSSLGDEILGDLKCRIQDPLEFQLALDEAAGRTFRSGVLCRDDAPVAERVSLGFIMNLAVSAGRVPSELAADELFQAIQAVTPRCAAMSEIVGLLPNCDLKSVATQVFQGISRGWIRPRIEPVEFESTPPDFPKLNAFRLLCARECLPLVDCWHQPCALPEAHYQVLVAMDGSLSRAELAAVSEKKCPELAFEPWLRHLAERGMFA